MSKVKFLPVAVINKIAAGELIERPASVVKELVENAIDADATRIDTQLEEGGKKLIRISDNGVGMDKDDIAIVFKSHTTSKLKNAEDLFAITTLGFRGEALPSIGAVSRASIVSRMRGTFSGAEINIEGGILGEVKEKGAPEGTQIEVQELFFNTPVRKKFMKTIPTEMSHISDVLTKFSLCYPSIHFTLTHNNRNVFKLPPVKDPIERIAAFFGNDIKKHLIPIFMREEKFVLSGYIAPPSLDKANTRMQFIFLNGRTIKNSAIYRAIHDAYHGKLMHKRYPIVFLLLQMEPSDVDVNVHPTKIEVRFRNSSSIYHYVLSAIKDGLNKLSPKSFNIPTFETKHDNTKKSIGTEEMKTTKFSSREQSLFDQKELTPQNKLPDIQINREVSNKDTASAKEHINTYKKRYFQIHNAYIVEETEQGMNIIDQHALHEIILFHEIQKDLHVSKLLSQRLLIPELIELAPKDFFRVMSLKNRLDELGIEIEEFGNQTLMIRSFPQILRHLNGKEFIENLIAELHDEDYNKGKDKILNKLINVMACKGAIKAGQKLESQEIEALLEKKNTMKSYTNNCPHGRPTTLFFSLNDLQKQFKRT